MTPSTISAKSTFSLVGDLKVELVYSDRKEIWFEERNLITLSGKNQLLSPLFLSGLTSDPVTTLKAGNGGTVDPQGLFPKQVNSAMTSLFNTIISVPTTYTNNPSNPSVTFLADITEAQCNGQLVNEAALFTGSNNMFNIKTFGGIPKTSAFSIHFEWTISIT